VPDFGITKGIRRGITKAKVLRPGEEGFKTRPTLKVKEPAVTVPAIDVPTPKLPPVLAPVETKVPDLAIDAESGRVASLNLGDYKLDTDWQTNFDTITTTDDIKAVIADVAEKNATKIQGSRRGVITNNELAALANDLDLDADVIRPVLERESGGVLRPEVILASRQVLNSSAERILNLAKKVNGGEASDLERIAFRRQILFHNEYQAQFMGARAEAGRALNAFAIPVGSDANQLARMREVVEGMHGHDTAQLAKVLSNVDSVQGVNKLATQYARPRLLGTTQELFINSILSGPKTHLVNSIGNALFQGMNIAETSVAARLGRFLSGEEHVMAGEASAMVYGSLSAWRDALRLAAKTFKSGRPLDFIEKFEGQSDRAISSVNLLPASKQDGFLGSAVDGLGAFIRLPTERVMAPTDEFFKTIAYRAELSRQAYLHAQRSAAGGPINAEKAIADFMENPPTDAVQMAGDYMTYSSFQNPLGPKGQKWQMALQSTPAGFLIAPFIRTPVNVFKAAFAERSPLAVFSAEWRAQVARGGRERDLALARAGMGTATVGLVAAAAASGSITGGGPSNPDARKILEATGWQPYSFRYENPVTGEVTYQSYSRAEPFAYLVGATADTVELLAYSDYEDELKTEEEQKRLMIAALVAGVANNTMNKTFMQGVADFTEAMSDPSRYFVNYAERTGMALLPYSSFRRQLGQMQDPIVREAWTMSEKARAASGIPGFSEDAPPRRDIFGEPIQYKGGSLVGIMSPFPDTKAKDDPILREIAAVMDETRVVPVAMPFKRVEGMKLEVGEYDEMVRYSRVEPLPSGRTFKEELDRLMSSSVYLLATPDAKATLIKSVQTSADETARKLLEKNNQAFAERLANHRLKKARRMYGDDALE
jgi:hypothetical protein